MSKEKGVVKFRLKGTSPLLMHSPRYSNPLDPLTKKHKELTSKRKKTDEDQMAIMHSEWLGSLYLDDKGRVVIPGTILEAAMRESGKLDKKGKQIQRGVTVVEDKCPLIYDGPKDIEKLWENEQFRDVRGVRVQQSKIMRCRPCFKDWEVEFSVAYDARQINRSDLISIMDNCGDFIGLCDHRPKFGRFTCEVIDG